jgi:tetratricopeptide (TPR) repeat protein
MSIIDKNPLFKKNIYLLLAVGYKKLENIAQAIKMLNFCVQKFPKYYDAYIYRGKLFMKDKKYEKALQDFSYAIQLNDQRALGLLGKADCLRFMG